MDVDGQSERLFELTKKLGQGLAEKMAILGRANARLSKTQFTEWPPSERVAYQADLVACVSWLDDAIRLHLDTLLAAGQEGEDDWLWNNYAQVIKKLEDNRTLRGEGDYGVGAPEEDESEVIRAFLWHLSQGTRDIREMYETRQRSERANGSHLEAAALLMKLQRRIHNVESKANTLIQEHLAETSNLRIAHIQELERLRRNPLDENPTLPTQSDMQLEIETLKLQVQERDSTVIDLRSKLDSATAELERFKHTLVSLQEDVRRKIPPSLPTPASSLRRQSATVLHSLTPPPTPVSPPATQVNGQTSEDSDTIIEERGMMLRSLRQYPQQVVENTALLAMERGVLGQVVGGHPYKYLVHVASGGLGAQYGYHDLLFLKQDTNPGLPRLPGQSGYMNVGCGNDWEKFTPEPCERTLFVGSTKPANSRTTYTYMGQYQCTRVQSHSVSFWLQLPKQARDSSVAAAAKKIGTKDATKEDRDLLLTRFNDGQVRLPCVELKFLSYNRTFALDLNEEYQEAITAAAADAVASVSSSKRQPEGPDTEAQAPSTTGGDVIVKKEYQESDDESPKRKRQRTSRVSEFDLSFL